MPVESTKISMSQTLLRSKECRLRHEWSKTIKNFAKFLDNRFPKTAENKHCSTSWQCCDQEASDADNEITDTI